MILAKRSFKGYSEEHRMKELDVLKSLSGGQTVSGRFSIDWTKTFEGVRTPNRIKNCLDCDNEKFCDDCKIKPNMNCFDCEVERACKSCLVAVSQKKTYFTDINMLKGQPPNEKHQLLPFYVREYKPKISIINFKAAKEVLIISEKSLIEKRRFERIKFVTAYKTYIKNDNNTETKEIFVYGFKHIKTDKVHIYIYT